MRSESPPVDKMGTESLAVPLCQSHIDAAERLHKRLEGWTATERAFEELQRVLPDYSRGAVLVKAAAIDRLYSTNVRGQAIHQVVSQIVKVMKDMKMPPEDPVAVVEEIIEAPDVAKRYPSFTSKFAHFFIDPERFPIYDSFCRRQTAYHLGRPMRQLESYCSFYQATCDLIERSGLSPSFREIDHYLWLAGTYHDFYCKDRTDINDEVLALFRCKSSEVKKDLKILRAKP